MTHGGRIVLLGATGYTGQLTAQAMVDRGLRPVLAGRNREVLNRLGAHLALAVVTSDASSVVEHLQRGDVLVSCAGPFRQTGDATMTAALRAGAHLVDCSGEAGHLRATLRRHPDATLAGITVLPGCGFDYVPGHVAALTALRRTSAAAVRILYLLGGAHGASRGTRASLAAGDAHVLQNRTLELHPEVHYVDHVVDGRPCRASVIGSTEALLLQRVEPRVRDVEVALGRRRRTGPLRSAATASVEQHIATEKLGGPTAAQRAQSTSHVVAWAGDACVQLDGPDGYDLTAALLAAMSERLLAAAPRTGGVRGPLELLDLDEATALLAAVGMTRRVTHETTA